MTRRNGARRGTLLASGLISIALLLVGCSSTDASQSGQSGSGAAAQSGVQQSGRVLSYQAGSDAYGIRMMFPQQPQITDLSDETSMESTQWFVSLDNDTVGYSVSVSVLPAPPVDDAQVELILQNAADGAARAIGGTLEEPKFVSFQGYPAQRGAISSESDGPETQVQYLNVLRDDILYSVMGIGLTPEEFSAFEDEFTFTD